MQWENTSSSNLKKIISEAGGVCILPTGSIEPHGKHLPLGTDYFLAHKVACLAAERETAVVFPPMHFGSVFESKALPGTVAIKPEVLFSLYENVLSEISRNGFVKIIILNGHGGNKAFLQYLSLSRLAEKRDYNLYIKTCFEFTSEQAVTIDKDCEGRDWGHACEFETSMVMAYFNELVDTANLPDTRKPIQNQRKDLKDKCFCEIDWYSECPDCYIGDASYASAERGKRYVEFAVSNLAELIKCVKADTATRELIEEYYVRSNM